MTNEDTAIRLPMNSNPDNIEAKRLACSNCGITIGYRLGDKLIVDAIEIEFKRSHQVKCKECGCETAFRVTGKKDLPGLDSQPVSIV